MLYQARTIFDAKNLNPNVTGSQGGTALHHAARGGYMACVTFLLDAGADVNVKGNLKFLLWNGAP